MLLRIAAACVFAGVSGTVGAQAYTENFDDISTLVGSGWFLQNNSMPIGSRPTWFQGLATNDPAVPGPFNAFNGANNAYIAANFANTAGTGTISNWLVTPNRTLRNGDVLAFYTRKPTIGPGQTDFPDRLEVRLSTEGASTNVGSTAAALGDFHTLLFSINQNLLTNVYPQVWTQYTVTLSGLPAPTSGRVAFRYFVTNAGPTGSNSDYIGIDNVVYTPYVCPAFTMTPGGALAGGTFQQPYSTSLTQTGALGAPTYNVTGGALPTGLSLSASGTISGTAIAAGTFIFSVVVSDNSGCSTSQSYSITVARADQAISFGTQAGQTYSQGGTFAIDPLASVPLGFPITYGSLTQSVCTVSGTMVTIVAAGTCTLTADQAGNADVNAAPQVQQSFVIAQAAQTLAFPVQTVTNREFGSGDTFAIDPLASSAMPNSGAPIVYSSLTNTVCTVSGTTVTMVAEGTCTLAANQAGDGNYAAAAQVAVDVVLVAPTQADLWIQKTTSTPRARIGDTVVYSIVVGNNGPADATNVDVLDLAPERLATASVVWECLDAVGTVCPVPGSDSGDLDVTLASLPEGATVRFELLGEVIPAALPADDYTAFDNTATVALPQDSNLTDPASGNNESSASVLVIPLSIFADGFEALPQR